MIDWDIFLASVPWFIQAKSKILLGESRSGFNLTPDFRRKFSSFSELLDQAEVTRVSVNDSQYELCSWDSAKGHRMGWLCLLPPRIPASGVCDDHAILFTGFGGIVERFNEPEDTWLLNLNDALTVRETSRDG
ncbi:MAG TPA: hypothetical protein ENL03_06705 [Phycisphaerae bacterium]|nr:hypothetical protein [Phycisphaerae bacterium]